MSGLANSKLRGRTARLSPTTEEDAEVFILLVSVRRKKVVLSGVSNPATASPLEHLIGGHGGDNRVTLHDVMPT